ncbi:MAG: protein kinase [Kofleriaceae bacterium]
MGPPERIIAGVVLCERLAVGMYGAVHRAQREGQRHLRALVVEPRLLAEAAFQRELLEERQADKVLALDAPEIVPTLAIESEGPEVVVLTRGVGRYVTVHDMLASARARGFKIERSVVSAVALAVGEGLAAAHRAGVVHGAVHPRSVLVDEDGVVRLTDFGVGRALTAAVAAGGDSALWRGLAGFLAPELAIGAAPGPESDVFAVGALLFVMLTGDAPPGALATTPAVERVVNRALDTEANRRYRSPEELADALRSAFSTDGWAVASPAEIIKAAGLEGQGAGLDDDTEDLLAALGTVAPAPVQPSMELRAEAVAARVSTGEAGTRLDALLADLDGGLEREAPRGGGEESARAARRRAAAGSPSLALDPPSSMSSSYDVTPLPPPQPQDALLAPEDEDQVFEDLSKSEDAAMSALADLRDPTAVTAKPSDEDDSVTQIQIQPIKRARAASPSLGSSLATPTPSLRRSPVWTLFWGAVVAAAAVGAVLVVRAQRERAAADERRQEEALATNKALEQKLRDGLPDPGSLRLTSSPSDGSGWLLLGRTPFDSLPLSSANVHQVRVELEGYQTQELTVDGKGWQGTGDAKRAEVSIKLQLESKAEPPLGAAVPEPPPGEGLSPGAGKIHFDSEPPGAAVWLYVGVTGSVEFTGIAGQPYELRVLKDGYLPGYVRVAPDDWRLPGQDGTPAAGPIDSVPKKPIIELDVTLTPDPRGSGAPRRRGG